MYLVRPLSELTNPKYYFRYMEKDVSCCIAWGTGEYLSDIVDPVDEEPWTIHSSMCIKLTQEVI